MSTPAGITITSSQLPGGPFSTGEIKVIATNASFGTQWYAYQGTLPSNPVWHETTNVAGNPSTFAPGSWLVMLRANQAVDFQSNPVSVTVVASYRTRVAVMYP